MRRREDRLQNERGVALLIVLLVTALLIALVFEFAYGTRVSLRAAVNFRDSERAYFLARSGVKAFIRYDYLQENISQGEWSVLPIVSSGDTEIRIRWEDERGKINITDVKDNKVTQDRLERLFGDKEVDITIIEKMKDFVKEKGPFRLLSELHAVMSEEEFGRIKNYLTVYSGQAINILTASEEVLKSAGVSATTIVAILSDRSNKQTKAVNDYGLSSSDFTTTGKVFMIYSYATVGGYTKQVEAVFPQGSNTPLFWRSL